jgi:hypothetical protein
MFTRWDGRLKGRYPRRVLGVQLCQVGLLDGRGPFSRAGGMEIGEPLLNGLAPAARQRSTTEGDHIVRRGVAPDRLPEPLRVVSPACSIWCRFRVPFQRRFLVHGVSLFIHEGSGRACLVNAR